MKNAVIDRQLTVLVDGGVRKVGERFYPGGGTNLIGNDAQLFTLSGETQHSQQEVLPPLGVNPTGTEHQESLSHFLYSLLARQFGSAVSTLRRRFVIFQVGHAAAARKYVVGGIVNETRPQAIGFLCQHARRHAVNLHGQFRLLFRSIHCGIGASIDDQVRLYGLATAANCIRVSKIQRAAIHRSHFAQISK